MSTNLTRAAVGGVLALLPAIAHTEPAGYEVRASDQSNSVADQPGVGRKGSFLWIWDSAAIEANSPEAPTRVRSAAVEMTVAMLRPMSARATSSTSPAMAPAGLQASR